MNMNVSPVGFTGTLGPVSVHYHSAAFKVWCLNKALSEVLVDRDAMALLKEDTGDDDYNPLRRIETVLRFAKEIQK